MDFILTIAKQKLEQGNVLMMLTSVLSLKSKLNFMTLNKMTLTLTQIVRPFQ